MNWFYHTFERAFVEKMKQAQTEKDRLFSFHWLESEKRWCGRLGELSAEERLKQKIIPYTAWTRPDKRDLRDFTIGKAEIDAKTYRTDYTPRKEYFVNVNVNQYEKFIKPGIVNTLLFIAFVEPLSTAIVLGWLTKKEFDEMKILKKKGDQSNTIKIKEDVYCVTIGELRPLFDTKEQVESVLLEEELINA